MIQDRGAMGRGASGLEKYDFAAAAQADCGGIIGNTAFREALRRR